jgi:hypothetical protein
MTDGEGPASGAELQAELQALIRGAYTNGVDVKGGWECRNSAAHPDWDVVVTEVSKPDDSAQ